jgi:hypothetical protein
LIKLVVNTTAVKPKPPYDIGKIYVAIYDYDARTDEDLTFRVGDLLKIIDDRFDRKLHFLFLSNRSIFLF